MQYSTVMDLAEPWWFAPGLDCGGLDAIVGPECTAYYPLSSASIPIKYLMFVVNVAHGVARFTTFAGGVCSVPPTDQPPISSGFAANFFDSQYIHLRLEPIEAGGNVLVLQLCILNGFPRITAPADFSIPRRIVLHAS